MTEKEIIKELRQNNSNIGMYFATFTLGSIRETSGNNDMAGKSFRQTSETIHKAVEDFVGEAEPRDDLTKMCIKM